MLDTELHSSHLRTVQIHHPHSSLLNYFTFYCRSHVCKNYNGFSTLIHLHTYCFTLYQFDKCISPVWNPISTTSKHFSGSLYRMITLRPLQNSFLWQPLQDDHTPATAKFPNYLRHAYIAVVVQLYIWQYNKHACMIPTDTGIHYIKVIYSGRKWMWI